MDYLTKLFINNEYSFALLQKINNKVTIILVPNFVIIFIS